eukprot:805664-Prymnesium_polylepis.1
MIKGWRSHRWRRRSRSSLSQSLVTEPGSTITRIPMMMITEPSRVRPPMTSLSRSDDVNRLATSDQPSTGVMTDCGANESAIPSATLPSAKMARPINHSRSHSTFVSRPSAACRRCAARCRFIPRGMMVEPSRAIPTPVKKSPWCDLPSSHGMAAARRPLYTSQ